MQGERISLLPGLLALCIAVSVVIGVAVAQDSVSVAFTVHEPDLIPEGITRDPATGRFFLGGCRAGKIVVVEADGGTRDFVILDGGRLAPLGMDVDKRRRVLWVAVAALPHLRSYGADTPKVTGVYKINIDTGAILARTLLPQQSLFHACNDLTLATDGTAYVTGFGGDVVYRVNAETCAIEEFVRTSEGFMPNGIDFDPQQQFLLVSGRSGLIRVSIADQSIAAVQVPDGENLIGIDGFYAVGNNYIAVQNKRGYGKTGTRIVKLAIDVEAPRLTGIGVLVDDHPAHDQPTTGVPAGESFLYIANSQFSHFDEQFRLGPVEQLHDVVILKVDLHSGGNR